MKYILTCLLLSLPLALMSAPNIGQKAGFTVVTYTDVFSGLENQRIFKASEIRAIETTTDVDGEFTSVRIDILFQTIVATAQGSQRPFTIDIYVKDAVERDLIVNGIFDQMND
ncbi:MAG: hypothetical protein AAFX93_15115 [Verrucomicrobiota bacterium]